MLKFITKAPINKGWSGDKKYCVTTADGIKYLLRVTPFEKSANRENMYLMQKEVEKLGILMCKPVPFGDGKVQTMLNQAKDVLDWYDNMQNPVPKWYE